MNEPRVTLDYPWLVLDLGAPMRVLSWAINRPGFVTARRIVWREIRNADLPEGLDARDWLRRALADQGETDSVAFLTSRNISRFRKAHARSGAAAAFVAATVGLSNAERVGRRHRVRVDAYGTINVGAHLNLGLSETGLIEAMSIAVQARTAAILDADIRAGRARATGTGTDCLAIADASGPANYAGLHTDVGEALGRAVYNAVRSGAEDWKTEQEKADA
ncbi:MAG: adenosylcobinamide amidohydrolase [Pseudomonadota bacterium]